MVQFRNRSQTFWVKDPKKIKWWRGLVGKPMSAVQELKTKELNTS